MKVLCAIDGSEGSSETVDKLAGHPWPAGTVVRVLTVAEKLHPSVVELVASGEGPGDVQRAVGWRSDVVAASSAAKLKDAGIASEQAMIEGDPKSSIVEEAKRWRADLVVVGHKSRSGLARLFSGSVAEYVVANAHCSVLVIRHDSEADES